jgi:hypothetical protein
LGVVVKVVRHTRLWKTIGRNLDLLGDDGARDGVGGSDAVCSTGRGERVLDSCPENLKEALIKFWKSRFLDSAELPEKRTILRRSK